MKFNFRPYGMALLGVALSLGIIGQASATPEFCPSPGGVPNDQIYNNAQTGNESPADGTEAFPGTYVGVVAATGTIATGNVCQIGIVNPTSGSDVALVHSTTPGSNPPSGDPSNYEFQWAGGFLSIEEEIGQSSFGGVDAELDSLASESSTSPNATLASIAIPAPTGSATHSADVLLYAAYLPSGYYTVSTYCQENGCVTGDGTAFDPQFQINFLVPEPTSIALIGVALLGLGVVRRRRRGPGM